jgi:hypothetical protein
VGCQDAEILRASGANALAVETDFKGDHSFGEQVIKQIWISPYFGVLSRYPSAADKPFPFIRPVVLPPHSAVKRP